MKIMLYLEKEIVKSLGIPKISVTEEEIENDQYNKQSDEYNYSCSNLSKINLKIQESVENCKVSEHNKKIN